MPDNQDKQNAAPEISDDVLNHQSIEHTPVGESSGQGQGAATKRQPTGDDPNEPNSTAGQSGQPGLENEEKKEWSPGGGGPVSE